MCRNQLKTLKKIKGHKLGYQQRLFARLPEKYVRAYSYLKETETKKNKNPACAEWFARAHLIVDYISGMTDPFSLEMYQKLSGNRIE